MLGKKAENLRILIDNGFNVPPFIVICLFNIIDNKDEFKSLLNRFLLTANQQDYNDIKKYIEQVKFDDSMLFDSDMYSVRSSCSLEDGMSDSFAGQFSSFLNVNKQEVRNRIVDCFLSMIDSNVLEYIKLKNINCAEIEFNVIVQEMIKPELSGVLFTSNPQGILNETVIVCGKGEGDNVVSDKTDTTTYYYNLSDEIYYYEGNNNLLSREKILELIDLSKKIVDIFGEKLDIEFAIKDNIVYLLQARRITTLNNDNILVMDNSNIVESYPGISLPLTISFSEYIYSEIFKNLCRRILKSNKEVKKREDVFKNMVGSFDGRLYYKISNWYEIINCLPFSKRIIPIWQEMLGVKDKTLNDSIYKLTPLAKAKTYFNFFYEYLSTPHKMKKLETIFDRVYTNFNLHNIENESKSQIIEL